MNPQTIAHLAAKYNVAPSIIERLANLSLTIQASGEVAGNMARRAYDRIVRDECGGVDPLV